MSKIMPEVDQNNPGGTHSTISQGTVINGDINSSSNLRFDGEITGTITCSAKIVIGKTAVINGNVKCGVADVYGKISGDIAADELSLKSTAVLKGKINTKQLSIEPGCQFSGTCEMGNEEKAL